jgi:hypothetical protein
MKLAENENRTGGLPHPQRMPSRTHTALMLAGILVPLAFLWGCAGVVTGQNTKPSPPPNTYSISGTISPAVGGNGATVTLSGAASGTTTANSSGNYTFTGMANGSYTVTPSHSGYTFNPSKQSVTVSGANVGGVNFTATAQVGSTFSLSGKISPVAGGSGATVTLSGAASATTTADSSGNYTFTGMANGSYTVSPSHTGYTFNPTSLSAVVNGANITGLNFTATAQTFSISGTISPAAGGNGATVTLGGPVTATTTANSSGNYSFSGLANGGYSVTPSRTGYTFSPTVQAVTVNGSNITGVDFTATAQVGPTFSISGTISPTTGGAGATVILSGVAGATGTTNNLGNYTFTGLSNGSYTVTPNNTGFTFTPTSQNVSVNGANITGLNFTAAAQQPHSVALTWNASTSTVSGYNVYRSTVSGSSYVKMNSSLNASLSFTDANVQNGTTYFYVTTAVDASGNESGFSNEVSAAIP